VEVDETRVIQVQVRVLPKDDNGDEEASTKDEF
jgi:hypothetical protein